MWGRLWWVGEIGSFPQLKREVRVLDWRWCFSTEVHHPNLIYCSRLFDCKEYWKGWTASLWTFYSHLVLVFWSWTRLFGKAPMKKVSTMYSDLIRCLTEYWIDEESNGTRLMELGARIRHLKELRKSTFERHCETVLYTLMFHLLDHVVEDVERFGNLKTLNALPVESFSVYIKLAYRSMDADGCHEG